MLEPSFQDRYTKKKNSRPCQETLTCLTLLMFCMRNIHFCHQAEGLELHARFELIMKIFCLSVSKKKQKTIRISRPLENIKDYSNAL